jgi:hypothetical protein
MFGSFYWGDFLEFVLLVTLGYYVMVVYLFYRKDFNVFLFLKTEPVVEAPAASNNLLVIVHEMVSELSIMIRQASNNETAIPELLFALQTKIKDFKVLEPTEYKAKINLYIAEELEIHGFHVITLQQIENLWKA